MKVLYFDCFSGISGDMFLGSLVDLGVPEEIIKEGIRSLGLEGLTMEFGKTNKNGIEARTFQAKVFQEDADTYGFTETSSLMKTTPQKYNVHMDGVLHEHGRRHDHIHKGHGHDHSHDHQHTHNDEHNHEHRHEQDHGHGHSHDHDHGHAHSHDHENGHDHNHSHEHSHDHSHSHDGHHHDHGHDHHGRTFAHIKEIIENSKLTERSKKLSIEIFRLIAEAEGKIHGALPEEVHFHEVGAFDSIADIVGAAIGIDWLDPEEIRFSQLPLTRGFVKCNHGIMPLPAPATLEILKDVPTVWEDYRFEMVTPTGAAIAKALAKEFSMPPKGKLIRSGYGAGKKTYDRPNVLRGMLMEIGEELTSKGNTGKDRTPETVMELQINVDDMTGEEMGYVLQKAFDIGALDAWAQPIYMKKNRPAYMLSFLVEIEAVEKFTEFLLIETSTFGVRYSEKSRRILTRRNERVTLPEGEVRIKVGSLGEKDIRRVPEYEDCRKIAEETGKPLREIMEMARRSGK